MSDTGTGGISGAYAGGDAGEGDSGGAVTGGGATTGGGLAGPSSISSGGTCIVPKHSGQATCCPPAEASTWIIPRHSGHSSVTGFVAISTCEASAQTTRLTWE